MLERVSPLRPGDAVRVALSREPDRSGVYEVDETGTVALPFLGTRKVTDVAPESLRRELLDAYRAQLRNQSIEVRLMRRVRVLGAVQKPGLYHVDRTMTLADLVAQAGGTTNQGSLDNIRLIREGQTIRSDVKRGTGAFQELRSGDQVYVPKRSWFARNSATVVSGTISVLGFLIGVAAF